MTDLLFQLDPAARRRAGLEAAVRDAIRSGRLAPGAGLPSTRALAAQLGMARGTVVEAYAQLAVEGWLVLRQGARPQVAEGPGLAPAARPPSLEPDRPRLDLRPGEPDASTFPRAAWAAAIRRVARAAPADAFGYGDPRGRIELRTALAGYLARARGVVTDPGRLIVAGGYLRALQAVLEVMREKGIGTVAMEDPCLRRQRQVALRAGVTALPVRVDAAGLDVARLEATGARCVVVTPAHQYPLGVTMSPQRRSALVAWARRTGGLVVEDDYDGEFRFDRQPVGALQGMAPDSVVYAGTASETLSPALRLAWLAVPQHLLEPILDRLGQETPSLDQLALADLIDSGRFDRHVRRMRGHYRFRRDRLVAGLKSVAPGLELGGISAGLHAVIPLSPGRPAEAEILERAAQRSLAIHGLAQDYHGVPEREGLVIGYSRPPAHAFNPALRALFELLS